MKRIDSDFLSDGTSCVGWLYLPDHISQPPVVIMAHGIAAERTFGLPDFAERFVERGLGVFIFDYRNFGDSDGQPRNLVNPYRHVHYWEAATSHVQTLRESTETEHYYEAPKYKVQPYSWLTSQPRLN